MTSRIWLINAVLALLAVFLGLKAYEVWTHTEKDWKISELKQEPAEKVPHAADVLKEKVIAREDDFEILVARNLFSPERTEIVAENSALKDSEATLSQARQEELEKSVDHITLYGMVISDKSAEALIAEPLFNPARQKVTRNIRLKKSAARAKNQGKKTKWVEVGDTIGEFEVVEINPTGLVLKAGSSTFDLLLYEKGKIKQRTPVQTKGGPVVVGMPQIKPASVSAPENGKKNATLPGKARPGQPVSGAAVPDKKGAPQAAAGKPSDTTDVYEAFLISTGNQKALESYRRKHGK